MWVVQRKTDGKYLKSRVYTFELWTLDLNAAKPYSSPGRAMNGMLEARRWTNPEVDRKQHFDDIKDHYQFVATHVQRNPLPGDSARQ